MIKQYQTLRHRRHEKIRMRLSGTSERPRLSIFRSNKHVWCQLIDDSQGRTLAAASGPMLKDSDKKTKTERAALVGELLAEKAKEKKITSIVFDRGGYKYHGRVKAVADALREKGLDF